MSSQAGTGQMFGPSWSNAMGACCVLDALNRMVVMDANNCMCVREEISQIRDGKNYANFCTNSLRV